MCYGNKLGVEILTNENLFDWQYGSFIVESIEKLDFEQANFSG
ncbi:MAG: hypothetical protein ACRC0A_02285 [Chitinophagaceae bacterium]